MLYELNDEQVAFIRELGYRSNAHTEDEVQLKNTLSQALKHPVTWEGSGYAGGIDEFDRAYEAGRDAEWESSMTSWFPEQHSPE